MKNNGIVVAILVLLLTLTVNACGSFQVGVDSLDVKTDQTPTLAATFTPEADLPTPSITPTETSIGPAVKRHTFGPLGLSMEIPADLYVIKHPEVNFDDRSKLNSYIFYIQNYGYPGGPSSGNFQMYGLLQYTSQGISWEQFSNDVVNSPMNEYANYIEIDSLKGYDTQLSGQRNRFVYKIYMEGSVLDIYVSEPTLENKAIADQIIQSLEVIPGGFSNASHVKLLSDPNQLYQILIPDDWEVSVQPIVGLQLSSLEATSPDLEVIMEEGGPHSNFYYKQGIFLHVQVIDDEIPVQIVWPGQQQYDVYFNGVAGTVYIYKAPSTVEGENRTVTTSYDGKTYVLYFSYADDADRDTIDHIIASFNITPETFYPTQ